MTQKELRQSVFELTKQMFSKNAYIKGYGDKFRVCDETHSPMRNIDKQHFRVLMENNIVSQDGLVYKLALVNNPFTAAIDVKLPTKE